MMYLPGGKDRHFQGQGAMSWSEKPALTLIEGVPYLSLSVSPSPHLSPSLSLYHLPLFIHPPLPPLSSLTVSAGKGPGRPCQDGVSNGLEKELEKLPSRRASLRGAVLKCCLSSCAEGAAVQRIKASLCCQVLSLGRCLSESRCVLWALQHQPLTEGHRGHGQRCELGERPRDGRHRPGATRQLAPPRGQLRACLDSAAGPGARPRSPCSRPCLLPSLQDRTLSSQIVGSALADREGGRGRNMGAQAVEASISDGEAEASSRPAGVSTPGAAAFPPPPSWHAVRASAADLPSAGSWDRAGARAPELCPPRIVPVKQLQTVPLRQPRVPCGQRGEGRGEGAAWEGTCAQKWVPSQTHDLTLVPTSGHRGRSPEQPPPGPDRNGSRGDEGGRVLVSTPRCCDWPTSAGQRHPLG